MGSAEESGSFLTPAEVAERLSISRSSVMRLIRSGELEAVKLSPRLWRIPAGAVDALLEKRRVRPENRAE